MTDSKGNVWHRYDKAAITYEIYCHTIVGKITTIVEGNVPEEYTAENENAYYTSLGNLVYESEIDCFGSLNWFTSQEAAANFIDNCRAKYE